MSSNIRRWAVVALVAAFVVSWRAETSQDVAAAQARTPIMMTRVYAGAAGLSHAEEIEMQLNGNVSGMMKATGVEFSRRPPAHVRDNGRRSPAGARPSAADAAAWRRGHRAHRLGPAVG